MTLSLPSALAAATNASMPPHAVAELAVLAVDSLQDADPLLGELPHAATTRNATAARPRRRVKLPNFMLRSPPKPGPVAPQPDRQGQ